MHGNSKILINSFITRIYIAHERGYSEALPAPVRPNIINLSCRGNVWEWVLGSGRRTKGRWFQTAWWRCGHREQASRVLLVAGHIFKEGIRQHKIW